MKLNIQYVFFFFTAVFAFASCANIVFSTGGPRDETAPLIKKRSLSDSAFLFKGGRIQFEFDEFVQLKDINNQLVITPLLAVKPKVTVHKKKATIYLPDSLLMPNTTYKVSLGNAIQDLKEGNAVKDLSFTFSTGSYFDSLSLKGTIMDAATGKPDTSSWILLYPLPAGDSVLSRKKPMYAQKANNGTFRIENLPTRDFYIYSLRESNGSLRYDATGEAVGFYANKVDPSDSSLYIRLFSFLESEKADTAKGKLKLKGKEPVIPPNQLFGYQVNIDTSQKIKRSFDITDSIVISFNDSIAAMDITKIRLFQGENFDATANVSIDTGSKKIFIKTVWAQDAVYTLKLLKSFAETKNKVQANAASYTFKTKKESDYGFLSVSTPADAFKIIELLKEEKVVAHQNATDTLVKFGMLQPGNYRIRVLDDKNNNGKWDTGNLYLKIMPEIVTLFPETVTIKANWGNKITLGAPGPKTKLKPGK